MGTTPGNDDNNPLQRLVNKARRLAGLTPELRQLIAAMRAEAQRRAAEMCRDPFPTPDVPPEEFVEVLRRPEGKHHLGVLIDGKDIQLVLNSVGSANPERESVLWHWLLRRVRQEGTE